MSQTEPKTNPPLFYSSVEPLSKTRHAELGLVQNPKPFAFAAKANAVPINTSEFNFIEKFYPIVFTPNAPHHTIAILGITDEENLFVNEDGGWLSSHYVPAYVRRYPFIFAQSPEDENQFVLCVETKSDLVSEAPDRPFFKDGELTETAQKAMQFCRSFHEESTATRPFIETLEEFDLLTERSLTVRATDGTDHKLGSFYAVDQDKLNNFDNETFLELRERKVLPLIYLHLASLSNWSRLLGMRAEKLAKTADAETRH